MTKNWKINRLVRNGFQFSTNRHKHAFYPLQCWKVCQINNCFDATVRTAAWLWSWKTWKGYMEKVMESYAKSWNFEYEPCSYQPRFVINMHWFSPNHCLCYLSMGRYTVNPHDHWRWWKIKWRDMMCYTVPIVCVDNHYHGRWCTQAPWSDPYFSLSVP